MKLAVKARNAIIKFNDYLINKFEIEAEILRCSNLGYDSCQCKIYFTCFDMISEWLDDEGIKITNENLEADEEQMITLQLYWGEE
jgi:hypothetical protein